MEASLVNLKVISIIHYLCTVLVQRNDFLTVGPYWIILIHILIFIIITTAVMGHI